MTNLTAREKQLKNRLEELGGRLRRIEDHLEQPPEPDWEENAIEAEMDEVLEGLGNAGNNEIAAIASALKRIKNGTYGVCVRCEIKISDERLDVLPHTSVCRTCAKTLDQRKS